jgi:hypothetical protein
LAINQRLPASRANPNPPAAASCSREQYRAGTVAREQYREGTVARRRRPSSDHGAPVPSSPTASTSLSRVFPARDPR